MRFRRALSLSTFYFLCVLRAKPCFLRTFLCLTTALFLSVPVQAAPPPFAQRVVTLTPHLAEWVYSAGAGERLVGVVQHTDFPAAAQQLPRIGSAEGLNFEAILTLQPDLIFAWEQGTPPRLIKRLQSLGLKVITFSTDSLKSIPENIGRIGKLLGTEVFANKEKKRLLNNLNLLQTQYAARPPISVFYQLWNMPLITAGGDMFVSSAIQLCGGHNIFASVRALAPRVSAESVLMLNPAIMLLAGSPQQTDQWKRFWQQYPSLTALQKKQLYALNADLYQRPTARFIDAIPELCDLIDRARS